MSVIKINNLTNSLDILNRYMKINGEGEYLITIEKTKDLNIADEART